MRVAISGGHLTPAVALMEYLSQMGDTADFFGREYSSTLYGIKSHEAEAAEQYSFGFYGIPEAKFDRYHMIRSIFHLHRHFQAVMLARKLLIALKSDIVVSFGGYLGLHLAIAGKLIGIPVVLHEQTVGAGLANRLIAKWASFIGVSYPASLSYFPKKTSMVTGNLVRSAFFEKHIDSPSWWKKRFTKPLLYITGGNQGSVHLNSLILELLDELTTHFVVVHQTGNSSIVPSYEAMLSRRSQLSKAKQLRYIVQPWFELEQVVWLMQHARVVVSRSGANSVAELMITQTPAVLLPLLGTSGNEQYVNAHNLELAGCAEVIIASRATSRRLSRLIFQVHNHHHRYAKKYVSLRHYHTSASVRVFYIQMQQVLAQKSGYL